MTDRISGAEMARSLTGFDEIAIEKAFGKAFTALSETTTARALVFIKKRREGAKDAEAYRAAMEMSLGELGEYFTDSDDVVVDIEGKASVNAEMTPTPTS